MDLVVSFGYKYKPKLNEYDAVYDVRHFPNPHSNPCLRPLDGTDIRVQVVVLSNPQVQKFIDEIVTANHHKIAIGCYGGRHRSVAIAEEIARLTGAQICHLHL